MQLRSFESHQLWILSKNGNGSRWKHILQPPSEFDVILIVLMPFPVTIDTKKNEIIATIASTLALPLNVVLIQF